MSTSDNEFIQIVADIKSAEKKAQEIKISSMEKSEQILKNAKEQVLAVNRQIGEEVSAKKNKIFETESGKIEQEVSEILGNAKKQALKIGEKELKPKKLESIFESITEC
ncbi:MAG: hypothetical protein WC501_03510 [Candidatus Micrarchaeia archaeon]